MGRKRKKNLEKIKREARLILSLIPWGKENAISREKLVKYTGMNDREIRDCIKFLRDKEIPILSSSAHNGYWLSSSTEEIEAFVMESEHRVRAQNDNIYHMRRICKKLRAGRMTELKIMEVIKHA